MINKEILNRIAHLIIWARHSKPGDDALIAPYDLKHTHILEIADELDSWITESFNDEY